MFLQTFRADSFAQTHRPSSKGTHLIDYKHVYASPCTIFASWPDALIALRSCDPRSDAKKGNDYQQIALPIRSVLPFELASSRKSLTSLPPTC